MDDLIQQGITAYKAGKRGEARKIFITVVKQNPESERAWGWMYETSGNDKERTHCLQQMLRINPTNEKAKQLLDKLTEQDFPFESLQEVIPHTQKNNATPIVQAKESTNTQKTPNPSQQKNTLVGAGVVIFICSILCIVLSGLFSSGDNGEKDFKTMAFIQCTVYVENKLKSPSTADFPVSTSSNFQDLGNNIYEIRSYVLIFRSFLNEFANYSGSGILCGN